MRITPRVCTSVLSLLLLLRAKRGIIGEDQWHIRLNLAALENSIIDNFFSMMWKSLPARLLDAVRARTARVRWHPNCNGSWASRPARVRQNGAANVTLRHHHNVAGGGVWYGCRGAAATAQPTHDNYDAAPRCCRRGAAALVV